ncbi:TerC family protein [Legionella sp. CNM-1927-20]|uniref:TerC family protein n=1 Tax=Legionella sp. CNM-1927-20 TaxID=3422221 RepID=UPI00403B3418
MEWFFDPTIWAGLLTLVTLEIILGIDNLIFIAILADKLPPQQRDKARIIGLSLAMIMRLILLSLIFWLVTLTKPLFTIGPFSFSGRDLILLLGGLFLLFKATMELHERLEGVSPVHKGAKVYASFGLVLTQIVVLDMVFSIDSVITAVGMVEELTIMVAAVIISITVMILASKPLTRFVNAHQTVIILCLGFLLMVGFSLVAEGFGFKIPKGYLYAAIGFSILIEFFNQLARRNLMKHESVISFRERTAQAVLHMLGRPETEFKGNGDDITSSIDKEEEAVFFEEERSIVRGALTLGERTIKSIMTQRSDISWINLNEEIAVIHKQLLETPHSFLLVCRGNLDNIVGVARAKNLLVDIISKGSIDEKGSLKKPIVLHESLSVIKLMGVLKHSYGQLLIVVDEYGGVKGLVTSKDVLEAIAGEFPDEDEQLTIQQLDMARWKVSGAVNLYLLEQTLGIDFLIDDNDYVSLAGFLLSQFNEFPEVGDTLEFAGFQFKIVEMDERRIICVLISKITEEKLNNPIA